MASLETSVLSARLLLFFRDFRFSAVASSVISNPTAELSSISVGPRRESIGRGVVVVDDVELRRAGVDVVDVGSANRIGLGCDNTAAWNTEVNVSMELAA